MHAGRVGGQSDLQARACAHVPPRFYPHLQHTTGAAKERLSARHRERRAACGSTLVLGSGAVVPHACCWWRDSVLTTASRRRPATGAGTAEALGIASTKSHRARLASRIPRTSRRPHLQRAVGRAAKDRRAESTCACQCRCVPCGLGRRATAARASGDACRYCRAN